jgi:xanthine dehydrogenase small subunit
VFTLRVNGHDVTVAEWAPQVTLLEFLRSQGLTGAKEGCAEGECGACAVAMVVGDGDRSAYRVINSCLMLLPMAAGREIRTIEGLAHDGVLQDAQDAMAACGGSQCGYCTPGFVLSLFAEQHRPGRIGPCDVGALSGNLCRCTGYRPIRDAALSLGPPPPGPLLDRLAEPVAPLARVSARAFSRPVSTEGAIAALGAIDGSIVVAGATDLGVEWNLRRRRWPHIIDLGAIQELQDSQTTSDEVRIGAAVPLGELPARWPDAPRAVHEWLELFASPLIRNRATLGGNLGTASPIGDAAPLLLALGASVELAGPRGRRIVPLAEFFVDYRKTAREPDEIIVSVRVPGPYPRHLRFYKIAKRRLDDISTVAAAMALDVGGDGRVRQARFAFGGVAKTPILPAVLSGIVVGQRWSREVVSRVQQALEESLAPLSDHRGSKVYRRDVSSALVEKFWWEHRA